MGDGIETAECELFGVHVCVMRMGRQVGFGAAMRGADVAREVALDALMEQIAEAEPVVEASGALGSEH